MATKKNYIPKVGAIVNQIQSGGMYANDGYEVKDTQENSNEALYEGVIEAKESSDNLSYYEQLEKSKTRQYGEMERKRDLINTVRSLMDNGGDPEEIRNLLYIIDNYSVSDKDKKAMYKSEMFQKNASREIMELSPEEIKRVNAFVAEQEASLEVMQSAYNVALKDANFFSRIIGMPMINMVQDILNPTDLGDVASLINVSGMVASGGVGGAISKSGLSLAGKIGATVGAEALFSTTDVVADYIRAKGDGQEFGLGDAGVSFGVGFGLGLGLEGLGAGVSSLIAKRNKQVTTKLTNLYLQGVADGAVTGGGKQGVKQGTGEVAEQVAKDSAVDGTKEVAEQTTKQMNDDVSIKQGAEGTTDNIVTDNSTTELTVEQIAEINPDIVATPQKGTAQEAIYKTADAGMGENGYSEATVNATGMNNGKVDVSKTPSDLDALDDNWTQAREVLKLRTGIDGEGFDIATIQYIKKHHGGVEFFKGKTQKDLLDFVQTKEVYDAIKNIQRKSNTSVTQRIGIAAYNYFTQTANKLHDMKENIAVVIAPNSRWADNFYARMLRQYQNTEEFVIQNLNAGLHNATGGAMKTMLDVYKFVNDDLKGNFMESILTGKLSGVKIVDDVITENANKIDENLIKGFQYYRKMVFENKLKMEVRKFYSVDDALIGKLKSSLSADDFEAIIRMDYSNEVPRYTLRDDFIIDRNKFGALSLQEFKGLGIDNVLNNITSNTAMGKIDEMFKGVKLKDKTKTIKAIKERVKEAKSGGGAVELINELLDKQRKYNNKKTSKIFGIVNKKTVLAFNDLFTTKLDINGVEDFGGRRRLISYEEAVEKAQALDKKYKTTQYTDRLNGFIEKFNEASGSRVLALEMDYNGYNVNGKSIDIRTTDIKKHLEKVLQKKGLTKEDVNKFLAGVHRDQLEKVGQTVAKKYVSADGGVYVQEIARNYLREMGVIDKVELVFKDNLPSGVNGQVVYVDGQKPRLELRSFNPNKYEELGILRHELEHIREFFNEWGGDYSNKKKVFKTFTNQSGISDEMFEKIMKGGVNIREGVGNFYNNHFFNYIDDTFETSYNGLKLSQAYARLTPYEKAQLFLSGLRKTTADVTENKLNVVDVINTTTDGTIQNEVLKVAMETLDVADEFELDNFIANRFQTPDDMISFLADITKEDSNKAFSAMNLSILNNGVEMEQGFSLREIGYKLSNGEFANDLAVEGYNINSETRQGMQYLGQRINHGLGLKTITTETISNGETVTQLILRALIGFRPFVDFVSLNALNVMTVAKDMNFVDTLVLPFKNSKEILTAKAISYPHAFADLIDSTGSFTKFGELKVRQGINKVFNDFLNLDIRVNEERLMTSWGVTKLSKVTEQIRKVGGSTEIAKVKRMSEAYGEIMTESKVYKTGHDDTTVKGWIAMDTNRALNGVKMDDITAKVIAERSAIKDLNDIFKANSFDELTPHQKQIYLASIYKPDEFYLFKENNLAKWTGNIDDIALDDMDIRSMYHQAEDIYDTTGKGMNLGKNQKNLYSTFNFLKGTVFSIATEVRERYTENIVDGVLIGKKNAFEISKDLLKVTPALIGSTSAYLAGGYLIKEFISNPLEAVDNIKKDTEELLKFEKKTWKGIVADFKEILPIAPFIDGSKSSTSYYTTFDFIRRGYQKKAVGNMIIKLGSGAFVAKVTDLFQQRGLSEKEARQKTFEFLRTKQGGQAFQNTMKLEIPILVDGLIKSNRKLMARASNSLFSEGYITDEQHFQNLKRIYPTKNSNSIF